MGRYTATQPAKAGSIRPSSPPVEARPREGYRDTVEAIVVAFILALVVRGFEAQAFVIPTGSMAPTLMGRHKEVACPQCGFVYAVNASQEVESQSQREDVDAGMCSNCRFVARLDQAPSFQGDRILVTMFPYDLPFLPGSSPPQRWDVVVFRYPEEPELSYIKRLIGLPGETIRIAHGDIYVRPPAGDAFTLARKPLRHQSAMLQNVYDDRYQPRALADRPEWRRWTSDSGWKPRAGAASLYEVEGAGGDQWSELRYRHLVPDPEQWAAISADEPLPPDRGPRSTLVTDFYSYNTSMPPGVDIVNKPYQVRRVWMQPHWVGDLALAADLEVTRVAPGSAVRFELVKAGLPHRCTIDLDTGTAVLSQGDEELARWVTPIKGPGRHRLEFANVDDRMTLVVDGHAVSPDGVTYAMDDSVRIPTAADLAPAAVSVRGASAVVVSDLVLKRDLYYTQQPGSRGDSDYDQVVWDGSPPSTPAQLFDFLSNPARFSALANLRSSEKPIGTDRFFMMGDNSPSSKDSRAWEDRDRDWGATDRETWEVPRQLLTGKAFYVYWPHMVPFGPDIQIRGYHLLVRPYLERMKLIR
jgi:signal peptidase I